MGVSDERDTPIQGLSPRKVAESLGVSPSFVYAEIKAGRMPHVRLGARRIIVEVSQLDAYLALRRWSARAAAAQCATSRAEPEPP